MSKQMRRSGAQTLLAVTASLLAGLAVMACGGGGGGGAESSDQVTSGLLPAPPALGPLILSDAATLRPLVDGASWRYHGTTVSSEFAVPVGYENTRQAARLAQGGFTESDSNAFGLGVDSLQVEVRGGDVVRTELLSLSPQMPAETIQVTELRSPVRQNDQYTVYDKRIRNGLPDSDSDGVAEDVDLVAYRRVIGEETVTLGALGVRRTVRVDFITQGRIRLSRDGRLTPVVTVQQRDWYEVGVGLVKRVLIQPNGTQFSTTTEELVSWDGVGRGLGVSQAVALRSPSDQPGWSDAPNSEALAAIKVGERVAIAAYTRPSGVPIVMTSDLNGTIRGLWRMDSDAQAASYRGLWTSDGSRMLLLHYRSSAPADDGWEIKSFGADAQPIGGPGRIRLQIPQVGTQGGPTWIVAVAPGEGRFWAMWTVQPNDETGFRLMLGSFLADGRSIGPVHQLDGPGAAIGERTDSFDQGPRLAAGPGGVLATWRRSRLTPEPRVISEYRYAWLPTSANEPIVRTLATDPAGRASPELMPAVSGSRGFLAWRNPVGVSGSATPGAQVVRLDSGGMPIFSAGQDALNTPLVDTRRGCSAAAELVSLVADEFGAVLSTAADCALWIDDPFRTGMRRPVRHLMLGDGDLPIAEELPNTPMFTRQSGLDAGLPVLFRDRLLMVVTERRLSDGVVTLHFTTVWRR